jgi:hypothetical protein
LVCFKGTCSKVKYLTISGNKDKNTEFVTTYKQAWIEFLQAEIAKNRQQVKNDLAYIRKAKKGII